MANTTGDYQFECSPLRGRNLSAASKLKVTLQEKEKETQGRLPYHILSGLAGCNDGKFEFPLHKQ
jgi:hypothetical protein